MDLYIFFISVFDLDVWLLGISSVRFLCYFLNVFYYWTFYGFSILYIFIFCYFFTVKNFVVFSVMTVPLIFLEMGFHKFVLWVSSFVFFSFQFFNFSGNGFS